MVFQWEYDSSQLEEGDLVTDRIAQDDAKFCGEAALFYLAEGEALHEIIQDGWVGGRGRLLLEEGHVLQSGGNDDEESSRLHSCVPLKGEVAESRIIYEDVDEDEQGRLHHQGLVPREGAGRWVFRKGRDDPPKEFLWAFAGFPDRLIVCFEELGHFIRGMGVPRA